MARKLPEIIAFLLMVCLVSSCASYFRKDLTLIDKAKLDTKAAVLWFETTHTLITQALADPAEPEAVKHTLLTKINPAFNQAKALLVVYLDTLKTADDMAKDDNSTGVYQQTKKIAQLQVQLNNMITTILNDLIALNLINQDSINQQYKQVIVARDPFSNPYNPCTVCVTQTLEVR